MKISPIQVTTPMAQTTIWRASAPPRPSRLRALAHCCIAPESRFTALSIATALIVIWLRRDAISHALAAMLLRPSSGFSLTCLGAALLIGAWPLLRRRARWRVWQRAIFPKRLVCSASTRADIGFFLMNNFATGAMIGWAFLSFTPISAATSHALIWLCGAPTAHAANPVLAGCIETLAMFLAYDFIYWLNHWLSHVWRPLWEFHRVHHTAETLTPLTVARVHPIDTLVFYNMSVVAMGATNGALVYALGQQGHGYALDGSNLIQLVFIYATGTLQHSHFWIAFTGNWGRIFFSPAHHQIHHSTNPAHFGKNLGSSLAIWDWLFGTLQIPTRQRMKISFGVEPGQDSPHSITGGLITPFIRAFRPTTPRAARKTMSKMRPLPLCGEG